MLPFLAKETTRTVHRGNFCTAHNNVAKIFRGGNYNYRFVFLFGINTDKVRYTICGGQLLDFILII